MKLSTVTPSGHDCQKDVKNPVGSRESEMNSEKVDSEGQLQKPLPTQRKRQSLS